MDDHTIFEVSDDRMDRALEIGAELDWTPLRIVPPNPWTGHLPFAFWAIKAMRPRILVELGTHSGNSYFAFCQAMAACPPTGRAFAVDTWAGDPHAGAYDEDVYSDVAAFNARHFSGFSTLLRGTFDEARRYFADGSVDLLHIDGLHTYEAVRHDFESWAGALSPRAVVLFHDINVRERNFGVWRLWQELSAQYPSFAFDHSHGLGVIGVGPEQSAAMQCLFVLSNEPARAAAFRRRIAARGEAFQRQVEVIDLRTQLKSAGAYAENLLAQLAVARDGMARHEAARLEMEHRAAAAEIVETEPAAEMPPAVQAPFDASLWNEAVLNSQREIIAAKEAMIRHLAHVAEARAAALAVRDRLLAGTDVTAAQLMDYGRHQTHMVAEERRVRHEMQLGYEQAIAHINQDREAMRLSLGTVPGQVAAEAARIAASYTSSMSWKVSRPLRVLSRLLQRRPVAVAVPAAAIAAPAVAAAAVIEAPAPVLDVLTPKQMMRGLLKTRLQSFLAGPGRMVLPAAVGAPDVSIILVLYNQAELTFGCLSAIIETLGDAAFGVQVVIADNGSTDETPALLDRIDNAIILRNAGNLHFLRAVNLAVKSATGEMLLLLNNDAQLLPGAVQSALATLRGGQNIGAVGARIILPDGTLQEAGSIIWRDGTCVGYARGEDAVGPDVMFQRDVDFCSGAFLLTPRQVFVDMGGFDECFAPAYYEETDYCVRLWEAGLRVVYDPDAAILHYEFGSSAASEDALRLQAQNHGIFAAKHREFLAGQFAPSPMNILAARTARSAAPRVLVLEDRVPKISLGAGYPRANRLVHELVDAGAQVTFFPMTRFKEDWHGARQTLDKRVELLIDAEGDELNNYLNARRHHFDAVLVCRPHNMAMLLKALGPETTLLGGAAILYDAEALFVTRDIQRRAELGDPVSESEQHRMVAEEVALTAKATALISVAPAEQQTLEDYGARNVHLLGHAIDDEPLPTGYSERDQIVFLGGVSQEGAPNGEAIAWFAQDILPELRRLMGAPDLKLTVVGLILADSIEAMDGDTLDLRGMVDDLPPALGAARVMVVPTRRAAGIPFKVHQAAMLGIPMVTTSLIAGQLGWIAGQDILVADEPEAFAACCRQLYEDEALWTRVRANALARARADCAPERFRAKVRELLAGLPRVRTQPAAPVVAKPVPAVVEAPNTSRPLPDDWSLAVPFSYPPSVATAPRVAVFCHLFHAHIAPEILLYLRNIPVPADLFITTDTPAKQAEIAAVFAPWDRGIWKISVTPNRGRDVAPKLLGFPDAYDDYDLVLHLHSKVSDHAHFLEPWRPYLLETLLGSTEIVRSVMEAFAVLPDLGMVAPQHFESVRRWLGWNGNYDEARRLGSRMGITLSKTRALDFPSGSMFWARPAALRPLRDLGLSFEDFPEEGRQVDHTPAHAIERLYFYACERAGLTWLKIADPAFCFETGTIAEITSAAALSRFAVAHGVVMSGPQTIAVRSDPAPMMTRTAPGLAARIAARKRH